MMNVSLAIIVAALLLSAAILVQDRYSLAPISNTTYAFRIDHITGQVSTCHTVGDSDGGDACSPAD
ncbi:MAG: hypothetical protein GC199_08375 [Alphaproteobacteria bacterium]|nr:hypothetical protein [Alphaproteobacteria bacterium]